MIIDYMLCPWRCVPGIRSLWSNESVEHVIIAEHPDLKNPVLIAKDIPQEFAEHIVELHNAFVKKMELVCSPENG